MPSRLDSTTLRTTGAAVAIGLAALALFSGCASSGPSGDSAASGAAAAATAEDLVGGAWVTGETYDAPDVPFLRFAADGSWSGSDGCNDVVGEWSLEPDGVISATTGFNTQIGCAGIGLPKMLLRAHTVAISGGSLMLSDESGALLVTLEEALEGTTPDADTGDDDGTTAAGTWAATPQPGAAAGAEVFLTLAADGTVSGRDGCNTLSGSWTEADGVVTFGALASTKMACEGVDTWLSGANSLSIDGSSATVTDASGSLIGTLERQG